MSVPHFRFSHRSRGQYYWKRSIPGSPAYEEIISCSVLWFWGWITDDTSLPRCDCDKTGIWGATGMMPDDNHVLVRTEQRQYLAHKRKAEA